MNITNTLVFLLIKCENPLHVLIKCENPLHVLIKCENPWHVFIKCESPLRFVTCLLLFQLPSVAILYAICGYNVCNECEYSRPATIPVDPSFQLYKQIAL